MSIAVISPTGWFSDLWNLFQRGLWKILDLGLGKLLGTVSRDECFILVGAWNTGMLKRNVYWGGPREVSEGREQARSWGLAWQPFVRYSGSVLLFSEYSSGMGCVLCATVYCKCDTWFYFMEPHREETAWSFSVGIKRLLGFPSGTEGILQD